jgi:hypothetical protein
LQAFLEFIFKKKKKYQKKRIRNAENVEFEFGKM